MYRIIYFLLLCRIISCLTGCERVSNSLSKPKIMMLQNTNPKLKFLANEVIKDVSKITKIPENKVKLCINYGKINYKTKF